MAKISAPAAVARGSAEVATAGLASGVLAKMGKGEADSAARAASDNRIFFILLPLAKVVGGAMRLLSLDIRKPKRDMPYGLMEFAMLCAPKLRLVYPPFSGKSSYEILPRGIELILEKS